MSSGLLVSWAGPPVMLSSLFPDNGLASLAGALLAAGHEVKVLDYNTAGTVARFSPPERTARLRALLPALAGCGDSEVVSALFGLQTELEGDLERLADELAVEIGAEAERLRADFVGFKLWSGDGFLASARIAAQLRQRLPALKLVAGGPAVLYSEEAIFDLAPAFDALVDGEGELAVVGLAEWAEGRRDLGDVPNLILPGGRRTRRELVPELDALPPPAYDPARYPALAGDNLVHLFVLDESRGCPMGCAFCNHRFASGSQWRLKSAEKALSEIEALGSRFGATAFRLGGSYTPAKFFEGLSSEVGHGGRELHLCGFAHVDGLSPQRLAQLARAGFHALFLGVESFAQDDRAMLGKKLEPARARRAIRDCLEAGIAPAVSLIVPVPGQSAAALEENRRSAVELCAGRLASVVSSLAGLMPRTRWWQEQARYRFALQVPEIEYRRLVATYRIRHLIPPAFWAPLPYTIDGRDFKGYSGLSSRFQQQLREAGVVINVPDEGILVADVLGEDLETFRRQQQALFFTLDASGMATLVRTLNARLRAA